MLSTWKIVSVFRSTRLGHNLYIFGHFCLLFSFFDFSFLDSMPNQNFTFFIFSMIWLSTAGVFCFLFWKLSFSSFWVVLYFSARKGSKMYFEFGKCCKISSVDWSGYNLILIFSVQRPQCTGQTVQIVQYADNHPTTSLKSLKDVTTLVDNISLSSNRWMLLEFRAPTEIDWNIWFFFALFTAQTTATEQTRPMEAHCGRSHRRTNQRICITMALTSDNSATAMAQKYYIAN